MNGNYDIKGQTDYVRWKADYRGFPQALFHHVSGPKKVKLNSAPSVHSWPESGKVLKSLVGQMVNVHNNLRIIHLLELVLPGTTFPLPQGSSTLDLVRDFEGRA